MLVMKQLSNLPPTAPNALSNGNQHFYKLDYSGNILFEGVLMPNDPEHESVNNMLDMVVDSNDNIIITGSFYGTVDADLDLNSSFYR